MSYKALGFTVVHDGMSRAGGIRDRSYDIIIFEFGFVRVIGAATNTVTASHTCHPIREFQYLFRSFSRR